MNRKYLAFDLETVKVLSGRMSDWKAERPLGVACAATYFDGEKEPVVWHGGGQLDCPTLTMSIAELKALVTYLNQQVTLGYTIVPWNGVGFDFDVLAEESGMRAKCTALALDHVDMMFHVFCQLGFGVSLSAAARGMRLTRIRKERQGALMPKLWSNGKCEAVLKHVAHDVRTTCALAKICEERGYLRWITRHGTGRMMRLPLGWQTVKMAQTLPVPVRCWLPKQWSRDSLSGWIKPSNG
jgi:hypothetical protein